jgi:hypothetical protein
MYHLHFPCVVDFFIHEQIDGFSFLLILPHQQVGTRQAVVTHGTQGEHFVAALLLHTDEITDWRDLMDQVIIGKGMYGPTAIPSGQLFQLDAEGSHRSNSSIVEILRLCL